MSLTKVRNWVPAIVLMLIIFIMSSIPSDDLPSFGLMDLIVKKGGHMLGYGLLGLAYLFALGDGRGFSENYWKAWILVAIYAASDELHQTFVPGRNGTILDVVIDVTGAALVFGLYYLAKKYRLNLNKKD